ncbi:hypothetical protein ACSIGC_00465 [Tenacibaculum sp. ZS6-P6]|uniref:hypothetical protein n=1 Tax=Tenacibaculum sp. ZS6-P6 TaxID=3447503 RepID=UPI003F9461EE
MRKTILNLGKTLNKKQQKEITGGIISAILPNGCGNSTCGTGCPSNQECVQIFCGPNGPFDHVSSEFQCIDIINHK